MKREEKKLKKSVAIYSRKSKFTGKGESIGNQIEMCKEYLRINFPDDFPEDLCLFLLSLFLLSLFLLSVFLLSADSAVFAFLGTALPSADVLTVLCSVRLSASGPADTCLEPVYFPAAILSPFCREIVIYFCCIRLSLP